ncbi:DUF1015 domain-containing protein [Oryzomonas sagensis]|uniref:DUF1015 domain-containing protein n=1 Tax=Oryzomonas sagensis TaxID=2603857 RepID=A0ABQ6TNN9_9BACT|nr:DUF1015 family protein [Oryzomonas sagensis]KAB0670209.1 DUF1015 domain-containing protein [Oryzomonas sagensis]
MAFIKPFRALRPPKDLADKVAALPYDVMNVAEARQMAAGNPASFLHVSRPEIDLAAGTDPHDEPVYVQGRKNLAEFIRRGILVQDDRECFYVYRQRMGEITQTGLVVCTSVDDYQSGVIKKHELTRADKEDDRVRHIDCLDANDEPVFYLSRSSAEIETIISGITAAPPEYDFTTDDGVSHTLWIVADQTLIGRLTGLFAAIPRLYVADGHHRSAAAGRVRELRREKNPGHTGREEYNVFLTVIFPETQLNIMPYNRAVKDLNGRTAAEFLARVEEAFTLLPSPVPVIPCERHQFGMYLDGRWYQLHARDTIVDESDTVGRLDVSILQDRLLDPILGIGNPRTDKRIHFVGGIRGNDELVKLVDSGEYAVAFSLYPTSIRELIELADQDRIMPPKSTWFEPKLRSGLFVHLLS